MVAFFKSAGIVPSVIDLLIISSKDFCIVIRKWSTFWPSTRQCPKWVYSVDLTKTFLFENKNLYFC